MGSNTRETVLIVEDNRGAALLHRKLLERAGFRIVIASSAAEALAHAAATPVDVALLDFELPDYEDGLKLYSQLKEGGHTFPVILVTGCSDEQTAIQALRAGVRDFIRKSDGYLELLPAAVERVLQQTQLERSLRQSEARLRALTDISLQFVWEAAADGSVVYANQRWYEYTGLTEEQTLGDGWTAVIHPDHRDRVQSVWQIAVEQRKDYTVEAPFRRADGEYRWHLARGTPIRDESDHLDKWIGVVVDIHDRKAAELALREKEAQLRQAQKLEAVGHLAGGVAHEYNNLLQAILGYAKFALEALPLSHPASEDLRQIEKIATRAATLTRQLLGFSRREVLRRANLDPNEQVVELLKMLRPLLGADIEVRTELSREVGMVNGDATLIQQMLLNLCLNARDAMPSGGRLTLETRSITLGSQSEDPDVLLPPGRYVLFSVSDTGSGIAPEARPHLFEPFFSTKEVGQGTGLGLAMVYGVAQQHGGAVSVDSEPNLGSTFKIYLPDVGSITRPAPAGEVQKGPEPGVAKVAETVLVADDEPFVRDVIVRALRRAGYQVLVATDGGEAIRLFEMHAAEIALALLDAVMPEAGGAEVARRIRQLRPDVPIVLCSGHDPDMHRAESTLRDELMFLPKPFNLETLLQTVRKALEGNVASWTAP